MEPLLLLVGWCSNGAIVVVAGWLVQPDAALSAPEGKDRLLRGGGEPSGHSALHLQPSSQATSLLKLYKHSA